MLRLYQTDANKIIAGQLNHMSMPHTDSGQIVTGCEVYSSVWPLRDHETEY